MKGGYQRINAPTNKEKQTTTDKEVDWRYRISNDKLREITNTLPINLRSGVFFFFQGWTRREERERA